MSKFEASEGVRRPATGGICPIPQSPRLRYIKKEFTTNGINASTLGKWRDR